MSSQPTCSPLSDHIPSIPDMGAPSQFSVLQSLLEDAVEKYKNQVGKSLIEDQLVIALRTCDSVESVAAFLEERARAFRRFLEQDRHDKIMKSIKRVVHVFHTTFNPVSGAVQVGHGIASIPFPPVKIIFAAIGILLATVKDVIGSYDALLDLFESLGNFVQRLDIYTKMPSTRVMTETIVKIIIELLSTLALAIKQIKQGRLKKFGMKLLGENEVEAALKRLDRLTQDEARATAAQILNVVYGLVQNMNVVMDDGKASTDGLRKVLETLQEITSGANKAKRDELQQNIRTWLSPPDPWTNHNIACGTYHKRTATWFIEGDAFTKWKLSGSLLWIRGNPGVGKTILCSTVIEDIDDLRKSGLASLAFFYGDFRDDKKKNQRGLLSSLIVQLCDQSDSYYEILSRFYSQHRRGSQDPSDDALIQCLMDILKCPGQAPIYIIVDALDECPNSSGAPSPRERVLMLVEELVGLHLPNLHICVTSRPEADIETVLNPLIPCSISLHDEEKQIQDILNYLTSVINADPKMRRWRAEDKELVIRTLSQKAGGMFRWVSCQIEYLRHCFPGRIRHALHGLPETLDATYERTLQDIHETYWTYAHRIFQCITVASRPLHVEELAEFLAFDFEAGEIPKLVEDWRTEVPEQTLLSTCTSLIAVVNLPGSRIVQFSHFSVKEFLMSGRLATRTHTLSRYHILMTPAHTIVAQACLGALVHLDEKVSMVSLENIPLAKYAAVHWVDHTQFENVSLDTKILFDPRKPHFSVWSRIYDLERSWFWQLQGKGTPLGTPLEYAARFGLHDVADFLVVERSQDVNDRSTFDNKTPLLTAVESGHLEVTRILLQHGADANARNHRDWTPLHFASQSGHVEVVQVLLERGADASAQDNYSSTPLHFASQSGHVEVVQVLLKRGADASAQDNYNSTPLHFASQSGHVEVVQVLLERGTDASARDNDSWTPLHLASQSGHVEVVQVLHECGADANTQNKYSSTPLHAASQFGHVEVAQVLLERDADASAQNKNGRTPLHSASQFGHVEVVRVLLERGSDASAQDKDGWTPLYLASQKGHVEVAQVLLERGADAGAQNKNGRTPLHPASQFGHVEVVRVLLERGSDASAQDKDGWTPLYLASQKGHVEVAQVLLERGADASAQNENGWTPLHLASQFGHVEVVRVLLERGADASGQNKNGWTSLHSASQKGHVEVVQVLLEHGADASAQNMNGRTPLHSASREGHVEVVQVLLERGADASAQNNNGRTPLHLASEEGHVEIVQVLLERGADASARDNDSWTPLHFALQEGHVEVVQVLLERGADASARDNDSWTPLHFALQEGHVEVVQVLLERGVDASARDNDGWTPLHFALREGHVEVVQVLLERGADASARDNDSWTPLHFALQEGHVEVVQVLLEGGADVSAQDKDGRTPLHFALQEGHVDVVQVLLEGGADASARDNDSSVPLHLASEEGYVEVVQVLLEGGADASAQDKDGWTPLHFASQEGHVDVVQVLLERGTDASAQDKDGWTPLHSASREGYVDVVRVLLEHGADASAQDKDGWTPLHLVSEFGLVEVVQVLLECGADVNAQGKDSRTPFQLALQEEHYSLTQVLLAHGAKEENHVSAAAES